MPDATPRISIQERNELIIENRNLVRKIAHEFARKSNEPYEDLEQVGLLAFIKALDRFDSTKNTSVGWYAAPAIRGAILQYLRDKSRVIRAPRPLLDAYTKVKAECNRTGNPNEVAVARSLGISSTEWQNIRQAVRGYTSSISEDFADNLADPRSAEDLERVALREALDTLEPVRRQCLELVYVAGISYKEAAEKLGISRQDFGIFLKQGIEYVTNRINEGKLKLRPQYLTTEAGEKQLVILTISEYQSIRRRLDEAEVLIDNTSQKYMEAERMGKMVAEAKQQLEAIASKFANIG